MIAAGAISASSLVKQAQLRRITTEATAIRTQVNMFRAQYEELPGDFSSAYNYFSSNTNCASGSAPTGCNGNGSKTIDYPNEIFTLWMHLFSAGLRPESFTGTSSSTQGVIGVNVPASSYPGGGWTIGYGCISGSSVIAGGLCGHDLGMGSYRSGSAPINPIVTPSAAQTVDTKYDDGLPGRGNIRVRMDMSTACVSGQSYATSTNAIGCTFSFLYF